MVSDPLWWTDVRPEHRWTLDCGHCRSTFVPVSGNQKFCSHSCRKQAQRKRSEPLKPPKPVRQEVQRNCAVCGQPFIVGRHRTTCGEPACKRALAAAKGRNRDHIERAVASDITSRQEAEMRRKTRKCKLCGCTMTSKVGLPNSKHLDHIIPLCQGGTHTHGNVRIICADCNLHRPKDGRDYTGPVTLWAQGAPLVSRAIVRRTCRSGLHPWTPENIGVNASSGKRYCLPCRQALEKRKGKRALQQQCDCGALFSAAGRTFLCPACREAVGHLAAGLHASGMTWVQVSEVLGYASRNGEGARYAAVRIGYRPARHSEQLAIVSNGKSNAHSIERMSTRAVGKSIARDARQRPLL